MFEKVEDEHKHEHTIVTQHDNDKNARVVKKKKHGHDVGALG
jgi:hypothetical protein